MIIFVQSRISIKQITYACKSYFATVILLHQQKQPIFEDHPQDVWKNRLKQQELFGTSARSNLWYRSCANIMCL